MWTTSFHPESLERHLYFCSFGGLRNEIHTGLAWQVVAILREAGINSNQIVTELNGLRPRDSTRPGDVVVLNFAGDGQHLLIDVACTTVWGNSHASRCGTVPGCSALDRENDKFTTDRNSGSPVSIFHGGNHILVPFVMEDGGRTGDQGQSLLRALAERAVSAGHIRTPDSWGTLGPAALVAHTVRRWQQRLSAWLHTKISSLVVRQVDPVNPISFLLTA